MMKFTRTYITAITCVAAIFFMVVSSRGESEPIGERRDVASAIQALLQTAHDSNHFNGCVLVGQGDQLVYEGCFGPANVEYEIPNTLDTSFRIGSIAKTFTVVLVLQLVDVGLIGLDDIVATHLPNADAEVFGKITIRQLLNHTSGLRGDYVSGPSKEYMPLPEAVQRIADGELVFEPGSDYAYSNCGYVILAAVLEAVRETTYEQLLNRKILEPLGMSETVLDSPARIIRNRSMPYLQFLGEFRNAAFIDTSYDIGGGGICSTVRDMWTFDRALHGGNLLSPESYTSMLTPGREDTGFAWRISDSREGFPEDVNRIAWHRGRHGGATAQVMRSLDTGLYIVILSNNRSSPRWQIAQSVFSIVHDEPVAHDFAPSTTTPIYAALKRDGVSAAIAEYRRQAEQGVDLANVEAMFNEVGFLLLGASRFEEALQVFRVSTELFPESENAFASLAYVHLKNGEYELARKVCDRLLEMNPNNSDVRDIINETPFFIQGGRQGLDYAVRPLLEKAGQFYATQKYEEAALAYLEVLAIDANNTVGWQTLGECYYLLGESGYDRAVDTYRRAAKFPPIRLNSLYNLTCVHALAGKSDAALDTLEECIEAGYTNFDWLGKDTDLDSLREIPRFLALVKR